MKKFGTILLTMILFSLCGGILLMFPQHERQEEIDLQSLEITQKVSRLTEKCQTKAEESKRFFEENNANDILENVALSYSVQKTADEIKILYDFDDRPMFLCISFKEGGYVVARLESEEVYERAEYGKLPYYEIETKCYYMGTGLYFYQKAGQVYEVATQKIVSKSVKTILQEELYKSIEREILFTTIQNNDTELETVSDASTRSTMYLMGMQNQTNFNKAYYFLGLDSYIYDYAYTQNGKKDLIFPVNTTNSCAAVAVTMILQYYDRLGLFQSINSRFDNYLSNSLPSYNALYSQLVITKSQALHNYIEANLDQWIWGETYNTGIAEYMPKYFKAEQLPENKLIFTANALWVNMKENIDRDMPCIGMVGTGTGYYGNPNGSGYLSDTINGHQMVVYGYTKNQFGGLDEFICHTGWHQQQYLASCIYTSGWSFAGNVTITENF